jgi:hypothetical protein
VDEREASGSAGGPLRPVARVAIGLGVAAVLATLVLLLIISAKDDQPRAVPSPESGTACSYLFEASRAYEAGDPTAFREAVGLAAQEAEAALERSGVRFGQAERMALELDAVAGDDPLPTVKIERILGNAERVCQDLGRWGA